MGDAEKTGTVDVDGSVAFYGSKIKTASKETLARLGLKKGVEVISVGEGKMLEAGASEGFVILYVNDSPVETAEQVIDLAKKARKRILIEGVAANGRQQYLVFGSEE